MRKLKLGTVLTALMLMCANTLNANVKYDTLINAIIQVESKHDTKAVSRHGTHVGILQISKGVVDDCNRILGKKRFKYNDRYHKERSIEMFYVIQGHYNKEGDFEKAIRIWNGGCNYSIRKTNRYYKKVWAIYQNLSSEDC